MTKITNTFGGISFFWNLTARWLVLWDQVVAMCLVHIAWPPWWLDKWLISPICCAVDLNNFGGILQIISSVFHLATAYFFPFQDWNQKFKFPHASNLTFNNEVCFTYHKKKLIGCSINCEKNKDQNQNQCEMYLTYLNMSVHLFAWKKISIWKSGNAGKV